jgi:hypothetical protein
LSRPDPGFWSGTAVAVTGGAQVDGFGKEEMTRLRSRALGREPERPEILRATRGYLLRHIVVDRLYRARILRY